MINTRPKNQLTKKADKLLKISEHANPSIIRFKDRCKLKTIHISNYSDRMIKIRSKYQVPGCLIHRPIRPTIKNFCWIVGISRVENLLIQRRKRVMRYHNYKSKIK